MENGPQMPSPQSLPIRSIPMYYVLRWYGELIPNLHAGQQRVMLNWSSEQNRVSLIALDGTVIFDVPASEVTGSELTFNEIKLKVNGTWHILYARTASESTDQISLLLFGRMSNISSMGTGAMFLRQGGIDELQQLIAANGHRADGINFGRALLLGLIGFFIFVGAIIALVIIFG